jgi:hypothetical protein
MKANICSVKYNPGSSMNVAVSILSLFVILETSIILFPISHISCFIFLIFNIRLVQQIIIFIIMIWGTLADLYIFSGSTERLFLMLSFYLPMSWHLHQLTVHCDCGMWKRITPLYVPSKFSYYLFGLNSESQKLITIYLYLIIRFLFQKACICKLLLDIFYWL